MQQNYTSFDPLLDLETLLFTCFNAANIIAVTLYVLAYFSGIHCVVEN